MKGFTYQRSEVVGVCWKASFAFKVGSQRFWSVFMKRQLCSCHGWAKVCGKSLILLVAGFC